MGEAIETGRRTKFRRIERPMSVNEKVNKCSLRSSSLLLDGPKRHLLPVPMASPVNNSALYVEKKSKSILLKRGNA